ncbi:hypothetical protein F5882DRAFT_470728 [Hyaloscypha sp. PMI_1271]|nr:hypothetical protein F5882DRAFT_470728 [Hyaloscypha sp. PMI_1271]
MAAALIPTLLLTLRKLYGPGGPENGSILICPDRGQYFHMRYRNWLLNISQQLASHELYLCWVLKRVYHRPHETLCCCFIASGNLY